MIEAVYGKIQGPEVLKCEESATVLRENEANAGRCRTKVENPGNK